jgi:sortase (surface protein transpeptidase)
MNSIGSGRHLRLAAGVAALLFLATGCSATDADKSAAPAPAPTTAAPSTPPAATAPAQPAADQPPEVALALGASRPVKLTIPKIDVQSDLIETGLRSDNTLEVPPGDDGSPASWYDGSPTPGQTGPAVLLGHVNSLTDYDGVFYRLRELVPGDSVSVTREDGSTATFEVYSSEEYPKDEFPTKAVYFPVSGAELRLITCGGYSESAQYYEDNLVVYARLTSVA